MAKVTVTRNDLTNELEAIRKARETEEATFKAALEKLYADHRKTMAELKTRRENAWKNFSTAAEALKAVAKKPAKKPAKKAAEKPAKSRSSRKELEALAAKNEVSDLSVLSV